MHSNTACTHLGPPPQNVHAVHVHSFAVTILRPHALDFPGHGLVHILCELCALGLHYGHYATTCSMSHVLCDRESSRRSDSPASGANAVAAAPLPPIPPERDQEPWVAGLGVIPRIEIRGKEAKP